MNPHELERLAAWLQSGQVSVEEVVARAGGPMIVDIGCFSFFSNKNPVTDKSGGVVTNDGALAEQIRPMRSHGMTSLSYDGHKGHAFSCDVVRLGYNYHATEGTAALACVQLEKLNVNNARRAELTELFRDRFKDIDSITIPFLRHPEISSCHLMPILLVRGTDRQASMAHLRDEGIQTSIHYPPVHHFAAYRNEHIYRHVSLPATEDVSRRQLTLPLHALLGAGNVEEVCRGTCCTSERTPRPRSVTK